MCHAAMVPVAGRGGVWFGVFGWLLVLSPAGVCDCVTCYAEMLAGLYISVALTGHVSELCVSVMEGWDVVVACGCGEAGGRMQVW
jgi:membrane associated rhomboid family serine protease